MSLLLNPLLGSFNSLDVKTVLRLGKEFKTIVSQSKTTPNNERMSGVLRAFQQNQQRMK